MHIWYYFSPSIFHICYLIFLFFFSFVVAVSRYVTFVDCWYSGTHTADELSDFFSASYLRWDMPESRARMHITIRAYMLSWMACHMWFVFKRINHRQLWRKKNNKNNQIMCVFDDFGMMRHTRWRKKQNDEFFVFMLILFCCQRIVASAQ